MRVLERSAVFDFRDSTPDRYSTCLSAEESSWLSGFKNLDRRRQSINARLCLKYLFLLQMDSHVADSLVHITEEELNHFPAWLYREISLVADESSTGRRFTWCGAAYPGFSVSVSHSQTMCGASIAKGRGVGMDVESIAERSTGFYRTYFSDAERAWVEVYSSSMDAAWLFTILWSLKECGLKTAASGQGFSNLPHIEILRFPDLESLIEIYESRAFRLDPIRFSVDLHGITGLDSLDCELTGGPKQVVTVARQST
jgi:hypothetical protein